MIDKAQQDIEQRVRLAGNNMFELLLFRLGSAPGSEQRELYGINVFKVREIVEMPPITALAGSRPEVMGVVDIRGQVMPVIDLAQTIGCRTAGGPRILLVTEFARTTQGFAVEEVDDIVRLEWNHVIPADASLGNGAVTGFARLDGDTPDSRLAQVIDVEQILRDVMPDHGAQPEQETGRITLRPGSKVLAADDSGLARKLIEQSLDEMGVSYVTTKSGREAWEFLQGAVQRARDQGSRVSDEIALVLTDLEMPEMDGFTLTRMIKSDDELRAIPVVIHSSLSGSANEQHVKKVGANGYVAKFAAAELADAMRHALAEA
ncbi:chemotaxis protein [Paraburkholderia kururiensis]|uniref:chemotaxis protein n=1 Tax=Paraburkholderia kururiensis TaxID=984307 RepID=UPI0005A85A54|nr:chemotaxis protein [Paraburkholderia kururiensis]